MSSKPTLTNWRKKDVHRFRNPDLVSICYATGCREVFDYHEAVCDLIEIESRNLVKVSLFTLARFINDDPPLLDDASSVAWVEKRVAAVTQLRDRGLLVFDGPVDLHTELSISVPDAVYETWWQQDGRTDNGTGQPRKGGKFATKEPAKIDDSPMPPNNGENGTEDAVSSQEKKKKKKKKTEELEEASSGRKISPLGIRPDDRMPLDQLEAEAEKAWHDRCVEILAVALEGGTAAAEGMMAWTVTPMLNKRSRKHGRKPSMSELEAGCRRFVEKVAANEEITSQGGTIFDAAFDAPEVKLASAGSSLADKELQRYNAAMGVAAS